MVWGPPGSFITGNNGLALALVMIIPLMYFLRLTTSRTLAKRLLVVAMVLCALSALGTQSRGALLAIAAMGAVLWWRAPNKLVNLLILTVLADSMWTFMPESWHDRMRTIQTYEEDASAMGRIYARETAENVANDRVLGAGFQMYKPDIFVVYAPDAGERRFDSEIARAAHGIYFQVLGEHGYIGLFLFMMVWFTAWRVASRLRRDTRDDPELVWLYHFGSMAQVSMVGWFAGGAFLSPAYWDLSYNIVVALIVAERWRMEYQTMTAVLRPVPPPDLKKRGPIQKMIWWLRTV